MTLKAPNPGICMALSEITLEIKYNFSAGGLHTLLLPGRQDHKMEV